MKSSTEQDTTAWIRFDYQCMCGSANELSISPGFDAVARICDGCESNQRLQFENAALALRCDRWTKVLRFSFSNGVACEPHPGFFRKCCRTAMKTEALMDILRLPPLVLAGGEG